MVQNSPTPFDVGRAFVHQYYTLLHQAPELLHRFYSKESTFIHGGVDRPGAIEQPAVGPDDIARRISELNLQDCHAKIRQVDSHPTIGQGVVVQVTGELSNNGHPMRRFMQTFVLAPRQPKKYYVQNDIFRYQDEVFDDGSDEDDRSSSQIYGDTDKVSNADSSAAAIQLQQQQQQQQHQEPPATVIVPPVQSVNDEQQPLPPRNQQHIELPSKVQEQTLNGLNEPPGYNDQQEIVQDSQQQTKQSQSTEGTSYAGITKLKSASGPIIAPIPPVQQPNPVRPTSNKPTAPPTRPTIGNQQQRGNSNHHQQNTRGNHQWNDNHTQQDQSPAHRSGPSVTSAPNEQQVFVGSLPLEFTRDDLIECFKQFGTVLDAKIHQPNYDNKKNFGFVLFDNAAVASHVVTLAHINYNSIRLNVEPKTQKPYSGNINNASQGNTRNYQSRNSGGLNRGGNRGNYRGNPNNPRRGGAIGQYGPNSPSFTPVDDNPKS